ncbi:MAG TPA: lipoyl(octanoyl) transferase LipB [Gammaproteobacteria bacterium]|nr:lipoyl(octanoyl) transferase LipB [Gammaproteobacteria bacterium]
MHSAPAVFIKQLGCAEYITVWKAMQAFTLERGDDTVDEFWVVEHPPVFTQGTNGKPQHLLDPSAIPVVQTDRGGQVTYHGPGQVVIYLLIDLKRTDLGPRALVSIIENATIALLADYDINAEPRPRAPGVYVQGRKIAALGLRIKRGCSYHGLSLNVDMDLSPFGRINPCGCPGLKVTQLKDLIDAPARRTVADGLCRHLAMRLGYNEFLIEQSEDHYVCEAPPGYTR